MVANMIPPETAPEFLARHGWEGAEIRRWPAMRLSAATFAFTAARKRQC
jgi:hypothetical protein